MPDTALLYILLSAVMHAGWNLVLKTTRHKLAFNVFMHASAIAIVITSYSIHYTKLYEVRIDQGDIRRKIDVTLHQQRGAFSDGRHG